MKNKLLISAALFCALGLHAEKSPFIHKVHEFVPAPGQFINELPEVPEDAKYEDVLELVASQICGDERPGMISLGSFGGYVVFSFDHPVINVPGEYDFKIYGNAIISDRQNKGGSSEPGIVMVSADTNGNGLPDDEWYELAGSEYKASTTVKNYTITYYRPDENKTPVPDANDKQVIDSQYIRWTTNQANEAEGFVTKNTSHSQSYWPSWMADKDTYTLTGTKLANNYINVGTDNEPYFVLQFLDWGYADNKPNSEDPGFNLDHAVDSNGNPVKLEKVDFIRVHTALNQTCGRLGESSTEICGARDLHPDAVSSISEIDTDREGTTYYYDLQGRRTATPLKGHLYIKVSDQGASKVRF